MHEKIKRVVIIVLDSVGIGALPDAYKYGDERSNTLANVAKAVGGLNLPNFKKMGLGNIENILGVEPVDKPTALYGKMNERSAGKETTTGHWEITGIILDNPFPVFPNGFPKDFIKEFQKCIGREVLGNKAASGTKIIEELGEEHIKTKKPIVYTSADSVFQIAAHEEVIPLDELYEICKIARKMLTGELAVGRVIARPFIGKPGNFKRTPNRHDYSLRPPKKTVLDLVVEQSYEVAAVGKVIDIFAGRGITDYKRTKSNMDGVDKTIYHLKKSFRGIIFTNLIDFDQLYGHRNDVYGYKKALEEFDARVPEILSALKESDLLIFTADHGCDPTHPGTDHTREHVPLLVYGNIKSGISLGVRDTFADVAATIANVFGISFEVGKSFADELELIK